MKNSYLTLLLLCLASPLLGQSKVVQGAIVFPLLGWELSPIEIWQEDSSVVMTYAVWTIPGGGSGINHIEYLRHLETINAPAFVLHKRMLADGMRFEMEPTLINHLGEDGYDPALGNGWVDTTALGFSYVRYYPWIWHPQLGWLYVIDGPISQAQEEAVTPEWILIRAVANVDPSYLPTFPNTPPDELSPVHEGQSYYLWSHEHGWLLKADLSHWFWSYDENDWLDLLNLVE